MRKMRTVLALMLALSLCLTMFPASIFAQADDPITEPVPAIETLVTEPEVEEEVDKAPEITTDLAEEEAETSQEPEIEALPEETESEEPAMTEEEQEAELKQDDEIEAAAEMQEEVIPAPAEAELNAIDSEAVTTMPKAEENDSSIVDVAVKAASMVKVSGYYSDFYLGYKNAEGNEVILGRPTNEQIIPPSYKDFPNPPYQEDQFVGWNMNGSRVDFSSTNFMPNTSYRFNAVWKEEGETWVTVSFKTGLGKDDVIFETQTKSGSKDSQTQPPSNTYNTLKAFGYKGFRYAENWFLLDDLLEIKPDFNYEEDWAITEDVYPYYFGNRTITKDTVFVPKWIKTWDVTFIGEDDKVIQVNTVDHEKTVKQPELKARVGVEYNWYSLDESGAKVPFDFTTPITSDLELHLEAKQFNLVSYYLLYPNGDVVGKPYTVKYSETENVEAFEAGTFKVATFEETGFKAPDGYKFIGWKVTEKNPAEASQPSEGSVSGGGWDENVMKKPALSPAAKRFADSKAAESKSAETSEKIITDQKINTETKDAVILPGKTWDLKAEIYFVPVWAKEKAVFYRTEYPEDCGLTNVTHEDERFRGKESFVIAGAYEFEGFEQPKGYEFDGWWLRFLDTEEEFNKIFNEDLEQSATVDLGEQQAQQEYNYQDVKRVRAAASSEASNTDASNELTAKVIVWPDDPDVEFGDHVVALLDARWKEIPSYHVLYDTNYPSGANVKDDAEWVDKIEITDPSRAYEYEIKSFEKVSEEYEKIYGEDRFIEPAGWTFIGWSEKPGEQPVIDYKFTDLGPIDADPTTDETVIDDNTAVTVDSAAYTPNHEQNNAGNETATGGQSGMVVKESKYDKVFYAQWKQSAVVYYHTNYPGSTGLQNDHFEIFENHEFAENTFTVKTFTDAFKDTSYEEPLGYKFVCWEMEVIDPKEAGDINQEENSEQNKDVEAEAQASAEVLQEAKKEVKVAKKEAIAAEKKDSVVTTEKEQSNSTEQETRPGTKPDFDAETATKLPQVQAGSEQDIHLEVHLFAIWEPCFKVIYHRVDPKSDFALDNKIKDQTYRVDYSVAQYKDGEGLFEVLSYPDTKLDGIPGYEFDYWTMTISDPRNPKDPDPANPFNPGEQRPMEPEHLEEAQAEKEYLKEESKAQDVRMIFKAAKGTVPAEAEQANKAESVEFLGKIEADKIKDEVGESTTPNDSADEKTDDPAGDAVDKIYPKDKEELHAEVHLYAWWKAKPYTVIWVDEDGKTPFGDSYPEDNNDKNDKGYPADSYMAGETQPAGDQYGDGPDKDGKVFDHWEKTGGEDGVGDIVYTAVYRDVQQNNPPVGETERPNTTPSTNRPSANETPITPEDPVTEEPTEIDDGDTPLAPGTVEEEDTNIDDGDVPLAGAEEEEEIAEEATPLTPFTGDERHTAVWGIVSILSLLGIVLLTYKRRREE